jgi:hypothetical protein
MFRPTLSALLITLLVAGCGGRARTQGRSAGANSALADPPAEAMSDTRLAAYAGNAKFPNVQPKDEWKVAAIVTPDRRTIKLYNFEGTALRSVNLWVNGAYVQPFQGVPAQGRAVVRTDKVFNAFGDTLAKRGEEVSRVQLETRDGLYNVLGPATE